MSTTTQRPSAAAASRGPAERPDGTTPSSHPDRFRADIQGLRALAVLAVALDHADLGPFAGGFVGVDVFFVISGFLITQLLLVEWQRTGTISLTRFYSRRARRILPAATLVLVATVLAGSVMLNFVRAKDLVVDAVWTTFFAANVWFGRQGTDYFAADDPPSPLQHYWSLAVEEQFYLVWPLLLGLLLGVFAWQRRRRGGGLSRRHALVVASAGLAVVIAASLAWCVTQTEHDATAAYFSTFARAWELAAGAACAVLLPRLRRLPRPVLALMAASGLAMIGWAVISYSSTTPFPGSAALVPVFGAVLVIAGGSGSRPRAVRLLLENAPMRAIGDWSYSFYLWHWPFLLLPAAYAGHDLDPLQRGGLLVAALAASYASYTWVENPARRTVRLSARPLRTLALYPVAVAVTLAACVVADQEIDAQLAAAADAPAISVPAPPGGPRSTRVVPDPTVALVEASVRAAQESRPIPGVVTQSLEDLRGDKADVGDCDYEQDIRRLCERGDVGSARTIVLFGDSHARHWIPAVDLIAEKHGYSAYYLVKPGCNPTAMIAISPTTGERQSCDSWRSWAEQQIARLRPDVLVLSGEVPDVVVDPSGGEIADSGARAALYREGLVATISDLGDAAGTVTVIGDVPGLGEHPVDCLAQRGHDLGDCLWPLSRDAQVQLEAARAAAAVTGSTFVDPTPWFCADDLCPTVIGDTVPYRDEGHVSTAYAVRLAGPLDARLGLVPQSPR